MKLTVCTSADTGAGMLDTAACMFLYIFITVYHPRPRLGYRNMIHASSQPAERRLKPKSPTHTDPYHPNPFLHYPHATNMP